jgi:spermidine/putrescine-binding protein
MMIVRIVCLSASVLLALAACGGPTQPAAGGAESSAAKSAAANGAAGADSEKLVNVYNWSDYIDPSVLKDFEAQTGVKVN